MKISADFAVDPANEVYKAADNGNPFVEVSINSLKVKDAEGKSIAPADVANYSDNLQFQADVNLGLTGISIGMAPDETTPAKDLNLGLYANLDLGNVQNNKTQFRLFLNFKNNPLQDKTEYSTNALDLIYKDGRLAMMVNNDAQLLGLPGVIGVNYGLVLAGSVGNMIDGILANYPTQKAIFDAEYWMPIQQKAYSYGEVNTDKTFNPNFKGFAIDGLDVSTILGLLGVNKAGTSEEAHTAAEDTNIYQTLLKVFNLLDFSKENTLAVGCDSVMDLLSDFVGMDAQGLKDMLNGIGIVGTLSNYLYVTGISPTDKTTANPKVADLVPELLDAPLSVEIGVDGGINLAIHLTHNKPEGTETFENHGAHIDATAKIKLSAEKQPIEQFDLTELINTFKAAENDINVAAAAQATAQATWDKLVAEFGPKYAELEETYKATEEFKTYSEASSALSEAKNKNDDKKAELSAFEEIGTNDYAGGRSFVYKYDKAYKEWVAAKGTANEKTKKDALDTALSNLTTAFGKYTESKAILAKWEELKPLIHDYRDKEAESSKASAAYKATQEYQDYTTYQGTWTTAAKAINAANTALSQVATQGFFYWDLKAQA